MSMIAATDDTFKSEVLESNIPVVVDFWAEWCGPCKQVMPIMEELSTEWAGKVKVVKVNIEESPETPSTYGVRGIPTLMLFKNGELADAKVGASPKSQIAEWVNGNIA